MQGADRVGPLLLERQLDDEAVDVAQQAGRRRAAIEADAPDLGDATGHVDREVAAVERELVGPLPEQGGALLERGGGGRAPQRPPAFSGVDARAELGRRGSRPGVGPRPGELAASESTEVMMRSNGEAVGEARGEPCWIPSRRTFPKVSGERGSVALLASRAAVYSEQLDRSI